MQIRLLGFLLICFTFPCFSQTPDYDLEVLTDTYTDLDNPTQLVTEIWDDPLVEVQLPFSFVFMGEIINELSNDNSAGIEFLNPSGTGLLAYPTDLIDRGTGTAMSESPISSQLSGTVGNRILKLEWKNAGFYNEQFINSEFSDSVNIQLWIYEVDDAFEIRFGPSKTDQPITDIHDFGGPTCGYGTVDLNTYTAELWTLEGDPLKPEQVFTILEEYYYYDDIGVLNAHPADGTVFRYTAAATVSTEEIKENTYLTVFPTRVTDDMHIKWNQEAQISGEVQVIDVTGKVQFNQKINDHLTTIDCQSFTPGIYFLRWYNEDGLQKTFKFIKN